MRHIVKTVGNVSEIVDDCETLEESLEMLEVYRSQASEEETYHIGYDDVSLNLEDWEEEWIKLCEETDREQRAALAEYRRNGGLYFEEFRNELDEMDVDDYEPTEEELEETFNELYYDEIED